MSTVSNSFAGALADELKCDLFDLFGAYLSVKAKLAYGGVEDIEHQLRAEGAQNICQFRSGSSAAFGYTLHGHAWIAFRGTHKFRELVATDLNLFPWGWPSRHFGFFRAWLRVREPIIKWINALPEDTRKLLLTGHSLGGALAVLAAFDLASRCPVRAVITFGAPRVGLMLFRHRYRSLRCDPNDPERTLEGVTCRYTHRTDLVSRIPPAFSFFRHVGAERSIDDFGKVAEGPPLGLTGRFLMWRWRMRWGIYMPHEQPPGAERSIDNFGKVAEGPPPGLIGRFLMWRWRRRMRWDIYMPHEQPPAVVVHHFQGIEVKCPRLTEWILKPYTLPAPPRLFPPLPSQREIAGQWISRLDVLQIVQILLILPIAVLWLVGAMVALVVLRTTVRDLSEHDCSKYVAAFRNRPGVI